MDQSTRIGVVIRMRPQLPQQKLQQVSNSRLVLDLEQNTIKQKPFRFPSADNRLNKKFKFDKVFDQNTTQEQIYNQSNIKNLVKKVVSGFNSTIFVYGQTGAGKTYTMDGYKYDRHLRPLIKENTNQGIIQRSVKFLFEQLRYHPDNLHYNVYCSYIQMYNENIFDLLTGSDTPLKLRWSKQEEFFLQNLVLHPCGTPQEVLSYFHKGLKNKIMGSHNLNQTSSRSHSILTLTVEVVDTEESSMFCSKLHLVDLAGSERVGHTGNQGQMMKESIQINKSLFTLRQVISTLSASKDEIPPYRDSKLTSLLKQSIGGNSYSLMIACLAPLDDFFQQNVSTLMYASQASSISNQPIKNIDPKTKVVKKLKQEIQALKSELEAAHTQIEFWSQLLTLNKSQQEAKLQSVDTEGLRTSQVERIRAIRASWSAAPEIRHSFPGQLSAKLLSQKLKESVKLIKDLMASNNNLKANVDSLSQLKKVYENQLSQLQRENQNLILRIEDLEVKFENYSKACELLAKAEYEKNQLAGKIQRMETKKKEGFNVFPIKSHKRLNSEWRSKHTVVKTQPPIFNQTIQSLKRPASVKKSRVSSYRTSEVGGQFFELSFADN